MKQSPARCTHLQLCWKRSAGDCRAANNAARNDDTCARSNIQHRTSLHCYMTIRSTLHASRTSPSTLRFIFLNPPFFIQR